MKYLQGIEKKGVRRIHAEHPLNPGEGLCGAEPVCEEIPLHESEGPVTCDRCCKIIRGLSGVSMVRKEDQI